MTIQFKLLRFPPSVFGQRNPCRSIFLLMPWVLVVMSLPMLSDAQQACQSDGDVDQNGSVTAADALLAFQQALSLAELSVCQLSIADVFPLPTTPDGSITASDALCIFQKALGLPSCLDTLPPFVESQPEARRLYFPFGYICAGSCGDVHYRIGELPNQGTGDAAQSPVYYQVGGSKRRLHVGVDQQLNLHLGFFGDEDVDTEVKGERGNFDLRHYEVNDGVEGERLTQFLHQSAQVGRPNGERVVLRFATPPVVTIDEGTTAADANRLVRAIQLVNSALPLDWRLEIANGTSANEIENGIHVQFMTSFEYDDVQPGSLAYTTTTWRQDATIENAIIKVDMDRYSQNQPTVVDLNIVYLGGNRRGVSVLAHELMHALGLGHVPAVFASIMPVGGSLDRSHPSTLQPLSILYPLDREALRALYGRLEPGDLPTDLGDWDNTSFHLQGNGDHAGFGVALRNGYAEPYAYGYMPDSNLADNPSLTGTATWQGILLGFTPEAEPVAGDAALSVELEALTGQADFTDLESWAAGEAPGNSGTGVMWGDGDLGYSITVVGNTFKQTGGDAGILTGAFFGNAHEGMGGTLERDDLTAAFGGAR